MKIIYKIVCSSIIYMCFLNIQAQQMPSFLQYYNNFNLVNPAYVGIPQATIITVNIRSQFAGIVGGPEIQTLSIHSPVGKNVGLGFSVVHDKVFVLDETHTFVDFSYSIKLSEKSKLNFGMNAGGTFLNIDLLKLNITDDMLFSQNVNEFNPNIGAGAYYYTDAFYFSLSALNLLQNNRYEKSNGVATSASDSAVWFISSGYKIVLNTEFTLNPSVMFRALKGIPLTTDVSVYVLWKNKLELGISHRLDESFAGIVQFRITDSMKVGYSYDSLTNNHPNFNDGSHEVSISFNIGKNKNKLKVPEDENKLEEPEDINN